MEKRTENFLKKTKIIFSDQITLPALLHKNEHRIYIIDENITMIHQDLISKITANEPTYILRATETNKNVKELMNLIGFLDQKLITRNHMVIAIGGGITTDLTGFAASIYKRGCGLILVPTSFLAMIDAAVGGKTGVNFKGIKNTLGTFYPADETYIVLDFLKSLPLEEIRNGWSECLKVAFISNSPLLNILETNKDKKLTREIIELAIEIKTDICTSDPFDMEIRRHLNLGHTFAHLLETALKNELSHGEAVAVGIRLAADFSSDLGYLDSDACNRIKHLLEFYDLSSRVNENSKTTLLDNAVDILNKDKKRTESGKLNLVLFRNIQQVFVKAIEIDVVLKILKKYL